MGEARRPREAATATAVGAAYVALTVWWLWPLPRAAATHSAYFAADFALMVADFYLIVWALAWDAHALVTAPWRLFHGNIFHPSPLSLAYSEHFLGHLPLFAPAYWATGNPILAVNVLLMATYPLCGLAMYLLARRWAGPAAAAVAGFFYAFSLWRYQALPHLHLLGVQYMPLALLFTDGWLEAARARDAVLLAAALVLQALSSFYLAFALVFAEGAYLTLGLWRWWERVDRRRLAGLGAAYGVTGAALLVTGLPYLRLRDLGIIPSSEAGGFAFISLDPWLNARHVVHYLGHQAVGPAGYALALVAIAPPWRGAPWARLLGVTLTLVGTLAAFGIGIPIGGHVIATPYRLLAAWLPGLSTVRMPARFVVVTQLGLALLAGLGTERLLGRRSARAGWLAAVATVVLALVTFDARPALPLHVEPTGAGVPAVYRWLAAHGGGVPLLELPREGYAESARRMYFSTYHWLPIVDGYSGYPPASADYVYGRAHHLPAPSALQELVDTMDLGWILVHRGELRPSWRRRWERPLPAGLERVEDWGDDRLLRVTRPVRDDRRARLFSTRETPGGVPLATLRECPGAIRVVRPPPDPWPPLSRARFEVEVENHGTEPWPALGLVPRHLVRLTASLARPEGPRPPALEFALPADVPARGAVRVAVALGSEPVSRDYVLELGLVQVGDGPLARCGTPPLRVPVRVAPVRR